MIKLCVYQEPLISSGILQDKTTVGINVKEGKSWSADCTTSL